MPAFPTTMSDSSDYILSNENVRMPRLIYGTAWKQERTAALVEQAIELGFRGIDTACQPKHYHEAGVGTGVAAHTGRGMRRDALYLQTKFTPLNGQDPQRIPYDAGAPLREQVAQSFRKSLENLQTGYLDGLILHSPLADQDQLREVWQAMEQLFHQGGVRQLGISNCYHPPLLEWLYRTAEVKPAVLQNRFYADTGYDREIRRFCRQHGIVYQAFWVLTANPSVLTHNTIRALAGKYRRTHAQIFFRFLSHNDVIPLTGTSSQSHMRDDLAIFDFELTAAECVAIDRLL